MTLALAGFYLDNPAYSRRARDKIWAWFLDPEAGMLPTLRGAAVQAGATDSGRPEGVFDLARLPDLINTVSLLRLVRAARARYVDLGLCSRARSKDCSVSFLEFFVSLLG